MSSRASQGAGLDRAFHYFSNPARFRRVAEPLAPWLIGLGLLGLLTLWAVGLQVEAATVDQKESARIFFVHVPLAISCSLVYAGMGVASLIGLVFRHELAHVTTQALAPLGALLTLAAFVTGAVWGLDDWGRGLLFEEPRSMLRDPRLLSVELLFLQYLAYLGLVGLFDDPRQGRRAGAAFVLASLITLVFVRYSPIWFNSIHQGPTLGNPDAVKPDFYAWLTYGGLLCLVLLVAGLCLWRMLAHLDAQRAEALLNRRLFDRRGKTEVRVETD